MEEYAPDGVILDKRSRAKSFLIILFVIVLIIATGTGTYYWQHGKLNNLSARVNSLQKQLNSTTKPEKETTIKSSSTGNTFTYTPKTGGLSLTLPKTFGVIVNVDGNDGGAPGAVFRVASVESSNTFIDSSYQGLQVDIGDTFMNTTLDQAVTEEETELSGQSTNTRSYQVIDTTVAGLPAKLIKTSGLDEYQGNVSVYLVGSGSFLYTITANGTQNTTFPILTTVLKGLTIKSVTL